jgi:hypothetical protein
MLYIIANKRDYFAVLGLNQKMTVKDFLDKLPVNYSDLDHTIRTHKTYDNKRAYQAREIVKKAYSVLS